MNKLLMYVLITAEILVAIAGTLVGLYWQRSQTNVALENISPGVVLRQEGLAGPQIELENAITAAPKRVMGRCGLAGATGGARVKLSSSDPQEVLLPVPQLAGCQVPICYFISCHPPELATEFRLRKREDCNVVISARLTGKNREAQLTWSAVVLFAPKNVTPNDTPPEPYRAATPCVQSQAAEIMKIAMDSWPPSGKAGDFAANIQRHVREMKRKIQPRSLDALGILQSGEGSICTANANFASAMMRSKGIACRSIAVIPTNSQRLEMHRIVEFFDNKEWQPFDPSSVQTDIPAKPWHNVIMAKTTTTDEQMAMKPRMGCMIGCPYGQEIELLSAGVNLHGQDFFWTIAKPLAEFEPTDEAIRLAESAWNRYLETGTLSQAQIKARSASTAAALADALRIK